MKVYLVRLLDDERLPHPREIVGIFAASSIQNLQDLVDQCTDPNVCEYRIMGEGGIMWTGRAKAIPPEMPDDDDEAAEDAMVKLSDGGCAWDELWCDEINWPRDNTWRRLVPNGAAWTLPVGEFKPAAAE